MSEIDALAQHLEERRMAAEDAGAASRDKEVADLKAQVASIQAAYDAHLATHPKAPRLYMGAATGGNGDPKTKEARMGVKYDGRRLYFNPSQVANAVAALKADAAAGRKISVISFNMVGLAPSDYDSWATTAARQLAAVKGDVRLYVICRHEPEGNGGTTASARDAWTAMQTRIQTIFHAAGIKWMDSLMGYYSFPSSNASAAMKALWKLENCIQPGVDAVAFDLYQWYGFKGKPWDGTIYAAMKALSEYCKPRGIEPWLTEFGINTLGFAHKDGAAFFDQIVAWATELEFTGILLFDSASSQDQTGLPPEQLMIQVAGDPRELAWAKVLKAQGK